MGAVVITAVNKNKETGNLTVHGALLTEENFKLVDGLPVFQKKMIQIAGMEKSDLQELRTLVDTEGPVKISGLRAVGEDKSDFIACIVGDDVEFEPFDFAELNPTSQRERPRRGEEIEEEETATAV